MRKLYVPGDLELALCLAGFSVFLEVYLADNYLLQ